MFSTGEPNVAGEWIMTSDRCALEKKILRKVIDDSGKIYATWIKNDVTQNESNGETMKYAPKKLTNHMNGKRWKPGCVWVQKNCEGSTQILEWFKLIDENISWNEAVLACVDIKGSLISKVTGRNLFTSKLNWVVSGKNIYPNICG